ncbi:MAG TPA: glutamate ABC transporter substrate-binding protein, partial [Pseudonocardiaceae bacterium]|nr:glutamate ABC transporter substrate-binding protein [Pseudonocardiaceae bacterium]
MRWNQVLRASVAVVAFALTATACGQQESPGGGSQQPQYPVAENPQFQAGTTMAALAQAGTIRIGTKFEQPLFGLRGLDGQMQGFDVEIGKIIAAGLGIAPDAIKWVEAPSGQREELIKQDKVDLVVATYTINNKRREQISFAGPYYVAGQSLMVKSDNNQITGPDSLRSTRARVCSVQGSASADNVLPYIDPTQLTLFDVYSKCADALRTGQVDVVTTDDSILLGFIDRSNGQFKLAGEPFTDEPYGIGISKGDVAFCEFIDNTLTKAAESGVYTQAWEATAGKVAGKTPKLPKFDPC